VLDVTTKFTPKRDGLRRLGIEVGLDSTLSRVNYWAYGPWENYNDRIDGVTVGRYANRIKDSKISMNGKEYHLRLLKNI